MENKNVAGHLGSWNRERSTKNDGAGIFAVGASYGGKATDWF